MLKNHRTRGEIASAKSHEVKLAKLLTLVVGGLRGLKHFPLQAVTHMILNPINCVTTERKLHWVSAETSGHQKGTS